MAGRIQLTTKGVQDIYFTDEPDYSHFVQLFKKHTNYTTQFVKLDVDGDPEFGKTVRLTIPKDQGDLIKTISLDVELNPIAEAEITRTGYVESIGHAMIEYVDMYIGDEKIQHIPSDYLQIYSEHNYTQTKQKALEKLIGKYPDRTSNVPVASGVILGHLGPATTSRKLFIDIPFYFYQKPELAIPLCAMCYQEVTLEIKFRELEDCVVKTDPPIDDTVQTVTLDYEVESSEVLTSNIMVVSNDGLSFASNVNDSIEITGQTTFVGDGIVSPALNVIVNSTGIYRYEDDQWVQRSTDSVSGDVQFSDDGNVVAQIGHGLWEWNGTGYDFRSKTDLTALSRNGSVYSTRTSGVINDSYFIYNRTTNVQLGDQIVFQTSSGVTVKLSSNGYIIVVALDSTNEVNIFEFSNNEWVAYGQVLELYEISDITLNNLGTSMFVYNVNEPYDVDYSGVGIVYVYDFSTSRWTEVYRYQGDGGMYTSINDTNTLLTIKKAYNETDYIKLQNITRSVENYDDIVVQGVENSTDTGSNVYGVGYQALVTQNVNSILFNTNTSYNVNATQTLPVLGISSIRISDDGLILLAFTGFSIKVFKRNRDIRLFTATPQIGGTDLSFGGETFIKMYISRTGKYFATVTRAVTNEYIVRVYNITSDSAFNNIVTDQLHTNITTLETRLFFNYDETSVVIYDTSVKIYSLTNPTDPPNEFVDNDPFNHRVFAVSRDLNRYVKYDSVNGVVKIANSDGSKSGLNLNIDDVEDITISKNGNIVAFLTERYTYVYSFSDNGWSLKSSLYVRIEDISELYDFKMSDDGNTLAYIDADTFANKSLIRLYVYNGVDWDRVLSESDLVMNGSGVIADIGYDMNYYTYVGNTPQNNYLTIKKINTQSETIIVNVNQEFSRLFPNQIKSCKVCLEMAFLDEYERTFIKKHKKDYVITQLQQGTYTIPKTIESHKIRTRFVNPVKEMYFVIKRVNNKGYEDFVSPFDYDNDRITSENKLIFYENLKSLELTLNDTPILDKDTGNFVFLKSIQPAIHHSKTPLIRRFYSYSFACEPEQAQPTGQVNFSLINNQLITANVTENTVYDRTLDVYALSYNVLRLDKGLMRMVFNT